MRGPVRFLCRNEIGMRLKINKSSVSGRGSCGARVAGDFFLWEVRGAGRRQALPQDSPTLRATEALRF